MRICFVSEYFWPEIGGLEHSCERLALYMQKEGHDIKIVTQLLPGLASHELRHQVPIFRFHSKNANTFCHDAARNGFFKNVDFICLFGVGHDPKAKHWQPLLECKNNKTICGIKIGTEGDILTRGIAYKNFYKFDTIFCQNPAIVEEAIEAGINPQRCIKVKNGLDIATWRKHLPSRADARKAMNISPSSFVVSGVGRFVTRKRFPLLVEAFTSAFEKTEEATLLLHGSDFGQHDGEESLIRKLVDNFYSHDIRIISPLTDTKWTLRASDTFCTLGEREGAPNIILEALASDCPVIATDISGHQVYIRSGVEGLILPDDSVKSIAEAMKKTRNVSLKRFFSSKTLERAKEFDVKIAAESYLVSVRNLLSRT